LALFFLSPAEHLSQSLFTSDGTALRATILLLWLWRVAVKPDWKKFYRAKLILLLHFEHFACLSSILAGMNFCYQPGACRVCRSIPVSLHPRPLKVKIHSVPPVDGRQDPEPVEWASPEPVEWASPEPVEWAGMRSFQSFAALPNQKCSSLYF
jgi:hypothetical protein